MADPLVANRPAGFRVPTRQGAVDPGAERLKATLLALGEPGRVDSAQRGAAGSVEVPLAGGYAVRRDASGVIDVISPDGQVERLEAAAGRLKLPGLQATAAALLARADAAIPARETAALPAVEPQAAPRLPSGASDAMQAALRAAHGAIVSGQAQPVRVDGLTALVLPGGGAVVQHGADVYLYPTARSAPFDISVEAAIAGPTSAAGALVAAARKQWASDTTAPTERSLAAFDTLKRSSMFIKPRADD